MIVQYPSVEETVNPITIKTVTAGINDSIVIDVYQNVSPFFKNYTLVLFEDKAYVLEFRLRQFGEDLTSENLYLYKETWELEDKSRVDSLMAKIRYTLKSKGFNVKDEKNLAEGISDFPRMGLEVYRDGILTDSVRITIKTQKLNKAFSQSFIKLWTELLVFDSIVKEEGKYLGCSKIN